MYITMQFYDEQCVSDFQREVIDALKGYNWCGWEIQILPNPNFVGMRLADPSYDSQARITIELRYDKIVVVVWGAFVGEFDSIRDAIDAAVNRAAWHIHRIMDGTAGMIPTKKSE